MLPTLRLKQFTDSSLLSLPRYWYCLNAFILLAFFVISYSNPLSWWVYPAIPLVLMVLLYEESWTYQYEKQLITYRRGLRALWVKEDSFKREKVQGLLLKHLGRHHTLSLKANGKVWEIERRTQQSSVQKLAKKLQESWSLNLLS